MGVVGCGLRASPLSKCFLHPCMDTTADHFTPLALRVRGNDSLGKGVPHAKRSLAKPFNDWALTAYITAVTAEVPLAFSPK